MGLVYLSSAVAIGNYFDKRRILAHGIAVCGSGAGLVLGPLLVDWLLREFEWPSAQLILAALALHTLPAGALYRPLESRVVLVRREQPPDDALAAAVAETASLDNEPDRERYILGGALRAAAAAPLFSARCFSFSPRRVSSTPLLFSSASSIVSAQCELRNRMHLLCASRARHVTTLATVASRSAAPRAAASCHVICAPRRRRALYA